MIFVQCRRTDAVKLTARQHWLKDIAGIHRTLGGAGPDDRMKLIDKHEDPALRFLHFIKYCLQPFLELTPVLRAGDE